ncbi:MAG TPA: hypothetical protein VIT91_14280 [Chthoniobacterales bacterium]
MWDRLASKAIATDGQVIDVFSVAGPQDGVSGAPNASEGEINAASNG